MLHFKGIGSGADGGSLLMSEFVCKVADSTGNVFQQVEAAQSEAEARHKLSERGLFVYSVQARRALLPQAGSLRRGRAVSGNDFLMFNQQFNTLIKAGLPILKALDLLAERAASLRLRPVLRDVRQRVREGALLSDAIQAQGVFPTVYTTSVLAGEKSGNLTGVLDHYIAYQRVTTGMRKRLLNVLIYPAILVVVATGILSFLVTFVIPQFAKLYADLNLELPGPTRLLVALVTEFRFYLLGAALLVIGGAVSLFFWSRSIKGGMAMDRFKLRLPVIGDTWIKFQVSQFVRTLGTLLAGGTPLVAALETSAGSLSSRLVSGTVLQAAKRVREGESLHASLAAGGLMPDLALEMIEVGEASGALAPMLSSVAEFYDEEVNLRLSAMISVIEPTILVFMALVVAFILIALYLPLFSFTVSNATG
jgi:type IV pilus assembly protein PilC